MDENDHQLQNRLIAQFENKVNECENGISTCENLIAINQLKIYELQQKCFDYGYMIVSLKSRQKKDKT